jgi:hypothetical protein
MSQKQNLSLNIFNNILNYYSFNLLDIFLFFPGQKILYSVRQLLRTECIQIQDKKHQRQRTRHRKADAREQGEETSKAQYKS